MVAFRSLGKLGTVSQAKFTIVTASMPRISLTYVLSIGRNGATRNCAYKARRPFIQYVIAFPLLSGLVLVWYSKPLIPRSSLKKRSISMIRCAFVLLFAIAPFARTIGIRSAFVCVIQRILVGGTNNVTSPIVTVQSLSCSQVCVLPIRAKRSVCTF